MKQQITEEQWDEIDAEKQYYFIHGKKREEDQFPLLAAEMPSIGQMIEFLDENRTEKRKEYWGVVHIDSENIWYVGEDGSDELSRASLDGKYEQKELCDALWEAVKEVLEYD